MEKDAQKFSDRVLMRRMLEAHNLGNQKLMECLFKSAKARMETI
jgi:hypothetical protein